MTELVRDSLWVGESPLESFPEVIDSGLSFFPFSTDTIIFATLTTILIVVISLYWREIVSWLSVLFSMSKISGNRERSGSFRFSLKLITVCFFLPLVSAVVYILYEKISYWTILALFFSYLIVKKIVLEVAAWVVGEKIFSHRVEETTLISFSLFGVLIILFMPIALLISDITEYAMNIYFIIAVCFSLFFFIILFMFQIIKGKFSLFWGFLYLCTLEFLPICVIASIFI